MGEQKSKQLDNGIRYISNYRSEYGHQTVQSTAYRLDDRGQQQQRTHLFAEAFRPALEFTEYGRARSPRTKRPGLETHYSPSSSTDVNNNLDILPFTHEFNSCVQ